MGSPKALLRAPDGRTFVERIVDVLSSFADEVVVITGGHHDEIVDIAVELSRNRHVRFVRNPDPVRGQLSSLWVGMDAVVGATTEAIAMTPVDVPMISTATVTAVVDAWRRGRAPIVRPAIGRRHGHPVIFDRAVFAELRSAPLEVGAKSVVHAYGDAVLNVTVDDEGCLTDVDTREDYRRLLG